MSDKTERHPIALKTVRYAVPGTDAVIVRRDLPYDTDDGALTLDIYTPPPGTGDGPPRPVVLIVPGYRDVGVPHVLGCHLKEMGMSVSWARLLAASGMVAITYTTRDPQLDVHTVVRFVRQHATSLGVADRIGLFAASANVVTALSALMQDAELTCAALLCGFTLDFDGSSSVDDAARTYGFVNACAGRSVDDLPGRTALFIARAGQDQFAGLNQALDHFVMGALNRNLPLTLVNYSAGAHGFDLDDDSDNSREIVRQILGFLQFHLSVSAAAKSRL
jgi:hypothetical protein